MTRILALLSDKPAVNFLTVHILHQEIVLFLQEAACVVGIPATLILIHIEDDIGTVEVKFSSLELPACEVVFGDIVQGSVLEHPVSAGIALHIEHTLVLDAVAVEVAKFLVSIHILSFI